MKQLTEKQAWNLLALWRQLPKGMVRIKEGPNDDTPNTTGLCYDVLCLHTYGLISEKTYNAMDSKLWKQRERTKKMFGIGYYWPMTPEGDAARIKFCLVQMKKCK